MSAERSRELTKSGKIFLGSAFLASGVGTAFAATNDRNFTEFGVKYSFCLSVPLLVAAISLIKERLNKRKR